VLLALAAGAALALLVGAGLRLPVGTLAGASALAAGGGTAIAAGQLDPARQPTQAPLRAARARRRLIGQEPPVETDGREWASEERGDGLSLLPSRNAATPQRGAASMH